MFTRSRFAGPSVRLSRAHAAGNDLAAAVVVSKNANVATGPTGEADARELVAGVAEVVGLRAGQVLIASTGVIGRPYPMDRVRAGLAALRLPFTGTSALAVARAMMTTDTRPKVAVAAAGEASVVGVAKGVGMIEPDMATMIALVFTDAAVPADDLDAALPPGGGPDLQLAVGRHRHLHLRYRRRAGQRSGGPGRRQPLRGGPR